MNLNISIDKETSWESALYALEWVQAILLKYKLLSVNNIDLQIEISKYLEKLYQEEDDLDVNDIEKIEFINNTYWPLIKEHSADNRSYMEKLELKTYKKFFLKKEFDYGK